MLYEDQAARFDERAAVPEEASRLVADAIVTLTSLATGDTLLEIGAGTGLLSLPLIERPIRYIGFDRSPAMLEVFRSKAAEHGLAPELAVADGNDRWPADDRSVTAIFAARSLHHVDIAHAVSEIRRVMRPEGGWLLVGRVRRPNDSLKPTIRRQMRKILGTHGFEGRNHDSYTEDLFTALEAHGAERAERTIPARWTRRHSPADSIASWSGKEGLAGLALPDEEKGRVLRELHAWAERTYGDVDRPVDQEEFFELESLHLPAH